MSVCGVHQDSSQSRAEWGVRYDDLRPDRNAWRASSASVS
jgi:hypothetical protein